MRLLLVSIMAAVCGQGVFAQQGQTQTVTDARSVTVGFSNPSQRVVSFCWVFNTTGSPVVNYRESTGLTGQATGACRFLDPSTSLEVELTPAGALSFGGELMVGFWGDPGEVPMPEVSVQPAASHRRPSPPRPSSGGTRGR